MFLFYSVNDIVKLFFLRVIINYIKKNNDFEDFFVIKTLELLRHGLKLIILSKHFFSCFF